MNDMQFSNGDEVLGGALNFRTGKKEAPDLLTDASSEGTEDDRTSKLASAFRTIIEVCILIRNVLCFSSLRNGTLRISEFI